MSGFGEEELQRRMAALQNPSIRIQVADAMAESGQEPPDEATIAQMIMRVRKTSMPAPDPLAARTTNPFENLPKER